MAARHVVPVQPWHEGERILQKKQGTVHTSDQMGPIIYHKSIPVSYRDMVGPQPQFMASFFDPETANIWASMIFAEPGFADCDTSNGTHLDIQASVDPRDGAAKMVKPGMLVGAVSIDFMTRRRNRFNGVIEKVMPNGHFSIKISQAFGNCPKYITRRKVRRMGRNLEFSGSSMKESSSVGFQEAAIISKADMMYFGTGTAEHGADMNIRGGTPGFVRVLNNGSSICWPDYMGNGFYMSLGNVQLQKRGALVFVDYDETGHGVQVVGEMTTVERSEVEKASDEALAKVLQEEPQALRLVVMKVQQVRFIEQYSPHLYERVELSPYNPKRSGSGPEFQAKLQWVRQESTDVKTFEFQLVPLPRPGYLQLKPGQHVRLGLPGLGSDGTMPERTWTVTSSPQWFADHGRFQISVKLKDGGLASTFLHQLKDDKAELHFLGFAGDFGPQLDPQTADLRSKASMPSDVIFLTAGIGSTPAVAAIQAIAEAEPRPRSLTVLHSVRQLSEAAFLEFFLSAGEMLEKVGVKFQLLMFLTGPDADTECKEVAAFLRQTSLTHVRVEAGRLSRTALTDLAVDKAAEGFLCGPPGFEKAASDLWVNAGFSAKSLRSESFAY
eukprot:Skav235375  [mRNA]  locus=scaffold6992:46428:48257:- [translate_table: standard]